MKTEKRQSLDIITPIKETTLDAARIVRIDDALLKEMTDGDPTPQFVVVDIEEGESNNKIVYDRRFFESVAGQVNTKHPAGYLGHKHFQGLDKEDLLPDPQVVWLGATVTQEGGKSVLSAKGYLLPQEEGGKARAWIKRQAINSVSWAGDAVLELSSGGKYRVKEFLLESIDFARKNRAGMGNQRLRVVTEMEGSSQVDDDDVKGIVGRLTFHELKEYNPGLVTVIKEQTKDEVKEETATAVQAKVDELTTKHDQEMKAVPEITLMQKVRELLGIKEDDATADPVATLATILERLDDMGKKFVQNWFNTEILEKKVPNEKARKLVGRLIPVTEMAGDFRSERGIEKIKADLEGKADDLIENDTDIQVVIKEMSSTRGGSSFSKNRHKDRDNNDDPDDPDLKNLERGGRLKVEEVSLGR
jgi:hypothetical protein